MASSMAGKLYVSLQNAAMLPGKTFWRLLNFMKLIHSHISVVIFLDSYLPVSKLDVKTQYGLKAAQVSTPSCDELFEILCIGLMEKTCHHFCLSPRVISALQDQISQSSIPFVWQTNILKQCLLRHVASNPFVALKDFGTKTLPEEYLLRIRWLTPSIKDEPVNKYMSCADYASILAEQEVLILNNHLIFICIQAIFEFLHWSGLPKIELLKAILSPDFNCQLFFEGLFSRMCAMNVEDFIGLCRRLQQCTAISLGLCDFSDHLSSLLSGFIETVRRHGDVTTSAKVLLNFIMSTKLFNLKSALSESIIFDDIESLTDPATVDLASNLAFQFKRIPSKTETILPTMPDSLILYNLSLGWQKLINAKDFYSQFVSIVKPGKIPKSFDQSLLMRRYVHATFELELVGFLAPTSTRRDHFERLNLCDSLEMS